MRVLLVVDDYLPESVKVAAKMMHELACELDKNGYKVTVLTPTHKISKGYEKTILNNISICKFKSGKIKNIGKVRRAINETFLSFNAWRHCKDYLQSNPHDIIIYYSPSIFFGPLILKLKKIWRCNSYLILRDLFPQWAIDQGLIKSNSLIEKYFRFFERKNYKAADKIGLMSKRNLDFFSETTKIPNLEVLFNWASNTPVDGINKYKKMLGIEDKVVFFYGGNIGHAQDMMNIVRLAKNMRDESRAYFVLVGSGDEYNLVKSSIRKYSIENMVILPPVQQSEYKKMLSEFDVGLFSLHKNHTTHNFPGKLLGYMVQSLPILGSLNNNNDLEEIIDHAKAGLISINGDDELFFKNAKKLLNDNYRLKMGENSNKLLRSSFSVEAAVEQIVSNIINV